MALLRDCRLCDVVGDRGRRAFGCPYNVWATGMVSDDLLVHLEEIESDFPFVEACRRDDLHFRRDPVTFAFLEILWVMEI